MIEWCGGVGRTESLFQWSIILLKRSFFMAQQSTSTLIFSNSSTKYLRNTMKFDFGYRPMFSITDKVTPNYNLITNILDFWLTIKIGGRHSDLEQNVFARFISSTSLFSRWIIDEKSVRWTSLFASDRVLRIVMRIYDRYDESLYNLKLTIVFFYDDSQYLAPRIAVKGLGWVTEERLFCYWITKSTRAKRLLFYEAIFWYMDNAGC